MITSRSRTSIKFIAASIVFLFPFTTFASTQVITGRMNGNAVSAGSRYISVGGFSSVVGTDTNASIFTVMPIAGSFGTLRVNADIAPSGADTIRITLRKNGVNTGLTCTLSVGMTSCSDHSHTATVAQGDHITYELVSTGSAFGSSVSAAMNFTPTTNNATVLLMQSNSLSNSVTHYSTFGAFVTSDPSVTQRQSIMPEAGVMDSLTASTTAPGGAGKTWNFTIINNAISSAVTCLLDGAAPNWCADNSHSFVVAPGDLVDIESIPSGTPSATNLGAGVRFTPVTPANFDFIFNTGSSNDSSAVMNYHPISGAGAPTATESAAVQVSNYMIVTNMAVKLTTAPGGVATRTFTVRKNSNPTSLTCTITGAETSCVGSATIAVSEGDVLDTSDFPANAPAASTVSISLVANAKIRVPSHSFFGGLFRLKGGIFRFR